MRPLFSAEKYKDTSVERKGSCISCGLFKQCETPKMKPTGGFKKGIMNIGPFPSKTDDEQDGKFLGKNRILRRMYAKYGIDLYEDCLNLNALACYPGKHIKSKKKLDFAVQACRRFVTQAIEEHKPKVVVLFGDMALKSVIGHRWKKDLGTINKWRGFVIPDQQLQTFICPTLVPSFIYDADIEAETVFEQDIKRIADTVLRPFPVFRQPNINVITDLSVLKNIKSSLCAFDYETTGIKPYNKGHKIYCASIAVDEDNVFVFEMPNDKEQRKYFKQFLKNPGIYKVAQNMKFEDTWSAVKLKTKVQGWAWDTQIASHILDNRVGVTGLKFQSYVNFGIIDYDSEIAPHLHAKDSNSINGLFDFVKIPENAQKVLEYCAMDSILEYRLMQIQTSIIGYDFLPF